MNPSNRHDKTPNFFMVGAPKCGTSAMFHYMEHHPQIFMHPHKEPDFFAEDLKAPQNRHGYTEAAWEEYLRAYESASDQPIIGEGTTWYLYSEEAAKRIHEFNPMAKILILLRNPIEQMDSMHSQLVYMGVEKISEFEKAVTGETLAQRSADPLAFFPRYMPPTMTYKKLLYKEIASYSDQVQRYWDVFSTDQVHVVVHDDLKRDPAGTFKGVLEFLEVDATYAPEYKTFNPNKSRRFKSDVIQRIRLHPANLWLARTFIPTRVRERSFRTLAHAWGAINTKYHPRQPIKDSLRRELVQEFTEEIRKLESMLDRDLSRWTELPHSESDSPAGDVPQPTEQPQESGV